MDPGCLDQSHVSTSGAGSVRRWHIVAIDFLQVDGLGSLAASIRLGFEGDPLTTVQGRHPGPLDR